MPANQTAQAYRVVLCGYVQGIGVRPAIARLANTLHLTGFVRNDRDGVEVHVAGPTVQLQQFLRELIGALPAEARVESFTFDELSEHDSPGASQTTFTCGASVEDRSAESSAHRPSLATLVPTDRVTCQHCLDDLNDNENRRWAYPLTTCAQCGPRYSVIEQMPFERHATTMAEFPLCDACRTEYESITDRRFHAQTIGCTCCGPRVFLRSKDASSDHQRTTIQCDPIRFAADALRAGKIIALRAIGGYQLLVDATNDAAVRRLRLKKQRPAKPLAVMVESLEVARTFAVLSEAEESALTSPAGPIVVTDQRPADTIADSVTDGLASIGMMLASSGLHAMLLAEFSGPLVCTSGNVEGEPIAYELNAWERGLCEIADVCLDHNRPIARPIDDSVVRVINDRMVVLRLARGFAPLALEIEPPAIDRPDKWHFLALGGQQKSAIAISNGSQAILGPHLGDLDSVADCQRFDEQVSRLCDLYEVTSPTIVCDQHPGYFSTCWAEAKSPQRISVQHHHAHIAAAMVEHRLWSQKVLGVAFDGTGYGSDGTIWGGEFLVVEGSTFERVGHLRPFRLIGGDSAVQQPWRVAAALVHDAMGADAARRLPFASRDLKAFVDLLERPALGVTTSSVGRLFDGVAALILGIEHSRYDSEAAMRLESACHWNGSRREESARREQDERASGYALPLVSTYPFQLDWRPMIRGIMEDKERGRSVTEMALKFHRGLADGIATAVETIPWLPVVLGGGVFQNRVLVEMLAERWKFTTRFIGYPGAIPPGDGGLAVGQLANARRNEQRRDKHCV
ncbi:MAG: carbamoyltransferase HypF [Planctomycetaceae bacterium]